MIKLSLTLIILFSFSANAVVTCDLSDSNQFADLTSISVPNCLNDNNLFEETDSQSASPPQQGPICSTCRQNLNARVNITDPDRLKLKQKAYFDTMYSELEKTMSTLMVDMVSMRKLYSTGSQFNKSINKCDSQKLIRQLQNCGSEAKKLFEGKDFQARLSNELASILAQNPSRDESIFKRDPSLNQCSISDQQIIRISPRLLESAISPEIIRRIANSTPTSQDNIWEILGNDPMFDLMKHHPILKSLSHNPTQFVNFFKSLTNVTPQNLTAEFTSRLYTTAHGDQIDNETSARCEQAYRVFSSKICSDDFNRGNISLGPMSEFERFNNDSPFDETDTVSNESLLSRNMTLLEFCQPPSARGLSLNRDTVSLNSWMTANDRQSTFNSFSSLKYNEEFGTPKKKICDYIAQGKCNNDQPIAVRESSECKLVQAYQNTLQPGTPEYRLAQTPDPAINNVLRVLAGNPKNLNQESRRILVAEGIIPQSNGQFVEPPSVPERQPDYLANVANGTINPNTGAPTTPTGAQTPTRTQTRTNPQQAVFQPAQAGNAVTPETVADTTNSNSNELRDFEDGLRDRLRRAESQTADSPSPGTRSDLSRRLATGPGTSTRGSESPFSSSTPGFAPQTDVAVIPSVSGGTTGAVAPSVNSAALGNDTSRQTRAQRQANEALANMAGAVNNPSASGQGGGRSPASTDAATVNANGVIALTINGDVRANIEQVLSSQNIRSLIERQQPFQFKLNNSLFDVRYNNGTYTVAYRSGDSAQGPVLASDLQRIFNSSLSSSGRTSKLSDLQNTVRN